MAKRSTQRGVTLVEMLTVLAIFFVLAVVAYPNVNTLRNRLRASEDARSVALVLGELRAEAIRIRQPVRVTFGTNGISWDIGNDGSVEGSYTFNTGSSWGTHPDTITINGFGLVRGLAGNIQTIQVRNSSVNFSMTVNSNGHVEVS